MKYDCDDEQLVMDASNGSLRAFNRLVECNQDKLLSSMLGFLGCREDAEEAVQEAFIRAFVRLKSFNRDAKFSTWLYRIAFNAAITERRKRKPTVSLNEQFDQHGREAMDHRAANVDSRMLRDEEFELIHTGLDALSDDHRAILVLRELDDLAYEEIADILKVTLGTVRSRLSRARQRLREVLEALQVTD